MLRRRYYSLRGLEEKLMRSVMIAALSALAAVATISVACAQNDQKASRPPRAPTTSDKPSDATVGNNPGITVQQETAIPYTACREAQGWVNGRLRCDNRY